MKDGHIRRIQDIQVGDDLKLGERVIAIMTLDAERVPMFDLQGVIVSGDHAVKVGNKFVRAENHPDAVPTSFVDELFNIITETHRMIVMGDMGPIVCADYEETEDTPRDLQGFLRTMNRVDREQVR